MRRLALLAPIAVLAAVLLVRHRRRRAADAPLGPAPQPPALAVLPEGPRFVSVPWSLAAPAPEDRAELAITYRCSEQMELDRVDAQETPTQVFVTVIARWRPPAGGWFAWEQERDATVSLTRPLGERELLHAPVDEEPPAGG
jgi:hypothetical protein